MRGAYRDLCYHTPTGIASPNFRATTFNMRFKKCPPIEAGRAAHLARQSLCPAFGPPEAEDPRERGREYRQAGGDPVSSDSVNEERSGMCAPETKRNLALMLLVSLAVLSGCTHHYLIKLSNGDQTISLTKPKLQGTNYHFTGGDRVGYVIPKSRVVKIRAISALQEEQKPTSPPKPKKPKHWYFLWLA
jgi:hypothetical protein